MLGFIKEPERVTITLDSLTQTMINDLTICYLYGIEPIDFQMDYLIFERTGIEISYPRITKENVQLFYYNLDLVKQTIINIIKEEYYTGNYYDNRDGNWIQGTTPNTLTELKKWVLFIFNRDYNVEGNWFYEYSYGDNSVLKNFLNNTVDLFIEKISNNDYNNFVQFFKNYE